jgi:hypothetical protein
VNKHEQRLALEFAQHKSEDAEAKCNKMVFETRHQALIGDVPDDMWLMVNALIDEDVYWYDRAQELEKINES